jgi:dTDP-4-amino-4,6-dideoxygalactose transaminase
MTIPLIDLVAQYHSIRPEIDAAIHRVLDGGTFILGPEVTAFEQETAAYLGVRHAVGVASGTDALLLALRAYGVGPGDEVVVPAYTFFATAEAVSLVGATPVFVDIDPRSYGLDVKQLEARLGPRTRAILPVHLYGHPADMDPIRELASRRNLVVIEDSAQAIGAEYRGRKAGGLGHAACLSFYPSKNLGAYGDGGMVVTDDAAVAEAIRKLRSHGWKTKYRPETIGVNSRLDELQAAVLRVKLRHLDAWTARRRAIAHRYGSLLAGTVAQLPWEAPDVTHVHHVYVIRVERRAAVQAELEARGIASAVYYPLALHQLEPYRGAAGTFPEAERAAEETLAIPLYPEMSEAQVQAVVAAIRDALGAS